MKHSASMIPAISHRALLSAGLMSLVLAFDLSAQTANPHTATPHALKQFPMPEITATQVPSALAPEAGIFGPARDYLLTAASQPTAMHASASDGAIWFSATNLGALGKLDRATGTVTYFPLGTGARPYAVTETPDRMIIAVDRALNVLHRLNPENGEATRIAMPADLPFLDLAHVRTDLDGRLWFSGASGWLGSHDPKTGVTDVSSHDDLQGLAFGTSAPNGTIWFVAAKSGRMIRIDPSKSRFDSAALPAEFPGIRGVAVGPNGEVWLASMKANALARYSGRGAWLIARLPWVDSRPQAIVVRSDGSVILADAGRRKLIRYRPGLDRFDEVGDLGAGGIIKAMIDLGDAVAVADMGSDRIRIFPDDPQKAN